MKSVQFSKFPKAYEAYPAVLKSLVLGQIGKFKAKKQAQIGTQLPAVEYQVHDFQVDVNHLRQYLRLCDFQDQGTIPAIYLAVLAQSLQMQMMSQEAFPFDILGLVHIANQIKQYRPIHQYEHLDLSCQFGELKPHDKGVQFDFIITAKVGDEVVMSGVTTYLSRQKKAEQKAKDVAENAVQPSYQLQATWQLAENIGRRYALNSGDFNLIHIHAKTAQLFGFKQAIAHGMWSNAKALAHLPLAPAYEADVQFKLPIFLPSTVELLTTQSEQATQVLLRQKDSHKPHMTMTVSPLSG